MEVLVVGAKAKVAEERSVMVVVIILRVEMTIMMVMVRDDDEDDDYLFNKRILWVFHRKTPSAVYAPHQQADSSHFSLYSKARERKLVVLNHRVVN